MVLVSVHFLGENMLKVEAFQNADWKPFLHEGCHNLHVKVLDVLPHLALAMLRFDLNGETHEHPADVDIDVYCLEGRGMVSLGSEQSVLEAGQHVRWDAGIPHKLWTTDNTLVTLMVEHIKNT